MIKTTDKVNSVKKKRIKIKSLNDFNKALKIENYNFSILTRENFKKEMIHNFNISEKIIDKMYKILEDEKITYKVSGIIDFINYIGDDILFEEEYNNLCKKISDIRTLIIDRVEYERILTVQDDVEDI